MNRKKQLQSAIVGIAMAASIVAAPFTGITTEKIASAESSDNYAKLLQYSMYFYDANMCGSKVDSSSAFSWRGNCHTKDEVDGGFHDAGDHAMFGLPQGYTASTLGWAYYEFKDAYDATGQSTHYKTISNYFNDFFKKSTQLDSSGNVTKLLYQKGDGVKDHEYWGNPESQETVQGARQMFWATDGVSDVAAEYAASLALNYLNFGNAEDLKYAKALYDFSTRSNSISTTKQGHSTFYATDSFEDDQAFAAGWLYIATKDERYLNDCKSKQAQYQGWCHSWNNVYLGAAAVLAEITGNWSPVTDWMGQYTNNSGYCFLDKWGSARLNASMQMTALIATKYKAVSWDSWAKDQMTYLLGQNPANTCFVMGFASNSAKNAHHRAASGYTSYDQFPTGEGTFAQYGSNGHILTGALVGGPTDANGTYQDNMNDYICNEVAVDYNAGLVGAAAGLYHFYKTGSVDSTIEGVGNVKVEPVETTTTTAVTTPEPTVTTVTTKTTNAPVTTAAPSSSGVYKINPNETIDYSKLPENDKMIGWEWSKFGIPANEKVTKVEIDISSSKNIGKWQGAFGTSTTVAPGYWTQTSDMQQSISSNSGTITWNVDSATSNIIQYNYGGELKWGIWWIDCGTFNIDEIRVYTGNSTTPSVTTAAPVTTTTNAPATTTAAPSSNGTYTINPNETIDYSKLPENDKMIGWEWSKFGIPANEKVTKVEINISSSKNIGKWQGAFGTSTTVAPGYWTQTSDMEQSISSNSGTITWNVDTATANIIQYNYGGELKWGIWWIDCGTFKIDSIKVYTTGSSAVTTTTPRVTTATTTTKATTATTKVTTAATTKVTTTATTKATTAGTPAGTVNPGTKATLLGDVTNDGVIDVRDVTILNQYIVQLTTLNEQQLANADVIADGKIDLKDLGQLKKYLIKVISSF